MPMLKLVQSVVLVNTWKIFPYQKITTMSTIVKSVQLGGTARKEAGSVLLVMQVNIWMMLL
jgi:hypothetical protein